MDKSQSPGNQSPGNQSPERPPMWVFGYGSLMWNPGFAHSRCEIARLEGYARSFCMWSLHHRGTAERPGLVLALDRQPGARCEGLALQIAPGQEAEALERLRARELVSSAYLERRLPVRLADGSIVRAVTFVIDRSHPQYCRGMPLDRQAEIIAGAVGGRGPNTEYLFSTVARLAGLGLRDPELEWLSERVRELISPGGE